MWIIAGAGTFPWNTGPDRLEKLGHVYLYAITNFISFLFDCLISLYVSNATIRFPLQESLFILMNFISATTIPLVKYTDNILV